MDWISEADDFLWNGMCLVFHHKKGKSLLWSSYVGAWLWTPHQEMMWFDHPSGSWTCDISPEPLRNSLPHYSVIHAFSRNLRKKCKLQKEAVETWAETLRSIQSWGLSTVSQMCLWEKQVIWEEYCKTGHRQFLNPLPLGNYTWAGVVFDSVVDVACECL